MMLVSTTNRNSIRVPRLSRRQWLRLLQVFSARLVLEVFGGVGAIWGCSEAVGLRHSGNVWFWRPAALLVGMTFLGRWISQLKETIQAESIVYDKELQDQEEEFNALVLHPTEEYHGSPSSAEKKYNEL
jgi:hypothetical protein